MTLSYPRNDLLHSLLMTLHLQEGLDLSERQVLPIPLRHQLIESAQKLKRMLEDFPLVQTLADACHHLGEQVERVDILEDVGLAIGDKDHVELVEGLVDITDIVLLDRGMLSTGVGELGEGGQ